MDLPTHPSPPIRTASRRRPLQLVSAFAVVATLVLAVLVAGPTGVTPASAASGRTFGAGPLDAVRSAAAAKASCGLSANQLAAMMIAPTYTEAGGAVPSPMTLSRYDNLSNNSTNGNLFAFGRTSGPYLNAFFSPGIGLWQFDSAGGWPFSAAGAIDSVTAANQAATTISYRWCNAPASRQSDPVQRRQYSWGPWYGCSTTSTCDSIYTSLLTGGDLDIAADASVGRYGGMQLRTCNLAGVGDGLSCWYINPALAQGARWWLSGTYTGPTSVTPLPKPFYVVEAGGKEYRVWLPDDTGYDTGITATKPITANARTSATWAGTAALCDITAKRGQCSSGSTFVGSIGASPIGTLDVVSALGPGKIQVQGWSIDQDTTNPIAVHVYVDAAGTALVANGDRPDVGAAYPGYGDAHGFDAVLDAAGGQHQVCAYAINVDGGANRLLGCRGVTVPSGSPIGSLDVVSAGPGSVTVAGWAIDPDTTAPIPVHVYVGGAGTALTADQGRPDVSAVFPPYGEAHGYSAVLGAPAGPVTACAYAINVGAGGNALLGCRTVTVVGGQPIGALDVVTRTFVGIEVAGWAIDPDTTGSIPVHVYVGPAGYVLDATQPRPDVAAAVPGYGPDHGYRAYVPDPGGRVSVCAYAINAAGGGSNQQIGCRSL